MGRFRTGTRLVPVYRVEVDMPESDEQLIPVTHYMFKCPHCGKPNNHWKWECEDCEDPLGGDGPDD